MKTPTMHLSDEHMQLYEWSGLGAQGGGPLPDRSKRTHAWHASYGVLAVLTSLLILNGCDTQTAAEQASEQVGQAAKGAEDPLFDDSASEAAAPAAKTSSEPPEEGEATGAAAPQP